MLSYSFEVGRRGKPDELDTNLANLVAAHFLRQNPEARFDIRERGHFINGIPQVSFSGEISENLTVDKEVISCIVNDYYHKIHRVQTMVAVDTVFKPQSSPLAHNGERKKSGDSGNPIAVAYASAPLFLPWERYLAVRLRDLADELFQNDGVVSGQLADLGKVNRMEGLGADGKISVRVRYGENFQPYVQNVVAAIEQRPGLKVEELRSKLTAIITADLKLVEGLNFDVGFQIFINGAGDWYQGGWAVDEGTREAKPQRQFFGPYGMNEDAGGGEDPSKPSATGTFLARYLATQVVSHGLAEFARVEMEYVIGEKQPTFLGVSTMGSGRTNDLAIRYWLHRGFNDLSLSFAQEKFQLGSNLYEKFVEISDYFQDISFPWNKQNGVE